MYKNCFRRPLEYNNIVHTLTEKNACTCVSSINEFIYLFIDLFGWCLTPGSRIFYLMRHRPDLLGGGSGQVPGGIPGPSASFFPHMAVEEVSMSCHY